MTGLTLVFSIIALVVLVLCIGPWLFMLSWNYVVPLFWIAAPVLTFWQAFVILILLSIIGRAIFGSKNSSE